LQTIWVAKSAAATILKQIENYLPNKKNGILMLRVNTASRGFTLIELMIALAVFTILAGLAIPAYINYSIRSKVGAALSLGAGAKIAVTFSCQEDPALINLTNQNTGYQFTETKYVFNIVIGGTCLAPTITITTQATGARPDPVLTITGDLTAGTRPTWTCVSSGLVIHAPKTCRS
jgi:type IV pilus assembly protein PilA